jgi:hypothetical protein
MGACDLTVYGVTAEAWSKRYGMVPFTHPCFKCGAPATTTIPFARGTLRGLRAPLCACGHPTPPYVMVRDAKHGDLLDGDLDK